MSGETKLYGPALLSRIRPWLDEIGKSDRVRLSALVKMAVTDRLRVSDCLAKLFPDLDSQKALAALTSFRKRINDAAIGDGLRRKDIGLRFEIDSKKKLPPSERACWFTEHVPAEIKIAEFSAQTSSGTVPEELVRPRGFVIQRDGKRLLQVFVSYAHANKQLATDLIERLKIHFKSSKRYILDFWIDQDLMVGEDWESGIQQAIAHSNFGLFMVSPELLASSYVTKSEMPSFINQPNNHDFKPVLPIGLGKIDFIRQDIKSLKNREFFLFGRAQKVRRFYSELRTAAEKAAYAYELYVAIEERLEAWFTSSEKSGELTEPFDQNPPETHSSPALSAPLEIWLESGSASEATIQALLNALSEVHLAAGGAGLEFRSDGDFVVVKERVVV